MLMLGMLRAAGELAGAKHALSDFAVGCVQGEPPPSRRLSACGGAHVSFCATRRLDARWFVYEPM